MNEKQYTLNLKSIESIKQSDDKLRIRAVVSASVVDRDGEVVDVKTARLKKTVDGEIDVPLLADHIYTIENILGSVESYEEIDDELIFNIIISQHKMKAIELYMDLMEGHIKNPFSIGFRYNPDLVEGNVIKGVEIHEVSAVVLAANQNSRLVKDIDMEQRARSLEEAGKLESSNSLVSAIKSIKKEVSNMLTEAQKKALRALNYKDADIDTFIEAGLDFDTLVSKSESLAKKEEKQEEQAEEQESVTEAVEKALKARDDAEKAKATTEAKKNAKNEQEESEEQVEDFRVRLVKGVAALTRMEKGEATPADHKLVKQYREQAKKSWAKAKAEGKKDVLDASDLGGSLVCYDTWREIQECNKEYGVLANLVTRVALQKDGLRVASVVGDFELTAIGNCDLKPEMVDMVISGQERKVQKFAGIKVMCDADVDDSPFAIFQIILDKLARADRKNIDHVVLDFDGNGDATKASGILDVANSGVSEVTVESTQITAGILAQEAATDCSLANATLVMNRVDYNKILLAHKDPTDCNCQVAGSTDIGGARFRTIWNYPVVISESIPQGKIIFGDFRKYLLLERQQMVIETSTEASVTLADDSTINLWQNDLTGVRAYLRRGGIVANPDAFVIINCVDPLV